MKNISILSILGLLLFTSCNKDGPAQSTYTFLGEIEAVKTSGGSNNDSFQSVVKTNDDGYAAFGFTQSNDGDITDKPVIGYDYWLVKYDSNDQMLWSKTFGGTGDDRGNTLIATNDNGFLLIGASRSNDEDVTTNFGADDFWIVKLDALGNITWEKTFGFSGFDRAYSAIQTNDGGYLITGSLDVTASNLQGNDRSTRQAHAGGDYWAIKLDANGNKIWRRYFGGSLTEVTNGVVQTNDNGFILSGYTDSSDIDISSNHGSYDYWLIKIDANGNKMWEKTYGGSQIDKSYAITKTADGNFIIVGDSRSTDFDISTNNGVADIWAIKIDEDGQLLWEKNYGGEQFDAATSITAAQDGGFYIAGNSRSTTGDISTPNLGRNDAWIIKISETGNLEWNKSIGGSSTDLAFGVIELSNKNLIIAGETSSNDHDIITNKGFTDGLLIKIK